MNRRNFFRSLATAVAGFTILPAATTYERVWKAAPKVLVPMNPEFTFEARAFMGTWRFQDGLWLKLMNDNGVVTNAYFRHGGITGIDSQGKVALSTWECDEPMCGLCRCVYRSEGR